MNYYRLLFISILVLFISYFFYSKVDENIKSKDLTKVIDFQNIDFAGEKVFFDDRYYFNREKFEKELNNVRYNIYQFVLYHKREVIYFPIIEKKLKEAGIPDDFKYLAVAESALKNDALSDSNAGGIWQFIPETGARYGLQINKNVDERYNFEKETDSAILYFQKLYKDFNNWTLAAAAYNRGENGIKRALEDQKVNSYYDLYLNEETARYVWRILAIKYIMQNRYKIFDSDTLGEQFISPNTTEISIEGPKNIKQWCIENKQIFANVKKLNEWIVGEDLPVGNWKLRIFK